MGYTLRGTIEQLGLQKEEETGIGLWAEVRQIVMERSCLLDLGNAIILSRLDCIPFTKRLLSIINLLLIDQKTFKYTWPAKSNLFAHEGGRNSFPAIF